MKRQTQILIVLLEVMALILAHLHGLGDIQTDEAKYLLNIPYPHPPFLRSILSFTDGLFFQEWLWRAIFATLLIQAVWLVWDMGKVLKPAERFAAAMSWLVSAAVVLQAGTVMMAPITALQALVFLWMFTRSETMKNEERKMKNIFDKIFHLSSFILHFFHKDDDQKKDEWRSFVTGMFWLVSLFTSYHIVLFLPVVIMVFAVLPVSRSKKILYFVGPILLFGFYTLVNPLIIGALLINVTKDGTQTFMTRLTETGWIWLVGGSGIASIVGTFGILRSKSFTLILSFILLAGYIFFSKQSYYAILFTPILVTGLVHFFHYQKLRSFPYVPLLVFCTTVLVALRPGWSFEQPVRKTVHTLENRVTHSGSLVIFGSFGHQWQYESRFPVRRYSPSLMSDAGSFVCTKPCEEIRKEGFVLVQQKPFEGWVRK